MKSNCSRIRRCVNGSLSVRIIPLGKSAATFLNVVYILLIERYRVKFAF